MNTFCLFATHGTLFVFSLRARVPGFSSTCSSQTDVTPSANVGAANQPQPIPGERGDQGLGWMIMWNGAKLFFYIYYTYTALLMP